MGSECTVIFEITNYQKETEKLKNLFVHLCLKSKLFWINHQIWITSIISYEVQKNTCAITNKYVWCENVSKSRTKTRYNFILTNLRVFVLLLVTCSKLKRQMFLIRSQLNNTLTLNEIWKKIKIYFSKMRLFFLIVLRCLPTRTFRPKQSESMD